EGASSTSVSRSRQPMPGAPPSRGWTGIFTRRRRRADDPSFLLFLCLCGRPHCLVEGDLFSAGIHEVDVKGSIGAVEEQTSASAAGLVCVMTRQRGVCAGHEPKGRTVLQRQSPPPADDQQILVRRVPVP